MYHGPYSSPLKNALDYSGFDEFENTTAGLLGISRGKFPTGTVEYADIQPDPPSFRSAENVGGTD